MHLDRIYGGTICYFARIVPKDAEVVVDFKYCSVTHGDNGYFFASGTALIPKPVSEDN